MPKQIIELLYVNGYLHLVNNYVAIIYYTALQKIEFKFLKIFFYFC